MTKKVITDVDRYVGERIRSLRHAQGVSQSKIAQHLGLTFQQVQKYEKGKNRISPGRLDALATLFGCALIDFFPKKGDGAAAPRAADDPIHQMATTRHGQRFAEVYLKLSPMMRLRVITLLEQVLIDKGRGR